MNSADHSEIEADKDFLKNFNELITAFINKKINYIEYISNKQNLLSYIDFSIREEVKSVMEHNHNFENRLTNRINKYCDEHYRMKSDFNALIDYVDAKFCEIHEIIKDKI